MIYHDKSKIKKERIFWDSLLFSSISKASIMHYDFSLGVANYALIQASTASTSTTEA